MSEFVVHGRCRSIELMVANGGESGCITIVDNKDFSDMFKIGKHEFQYLGHNGDGTIEWDVYSKWARMW